MGMPSHRHIHHKEFYFVRHGEAAFDPAMTCNQPNAPLSSRGRQQAHSIKGVIEQLPIKTICVSPLLRAEETRQIICENLRCQEVVVVPELEECTALIWERMVALDHNDVSHSLCDSVRSFFTRTIEGINKALQNPGPVLIVAHGGIHWAMCHHMDVVHEKKIDNCVPVHFFPLEKQWQASILARPVS